MVLPTQLTFPNRAAAAAPLMDTPAAIRQPAGQVQTTSGAASLSSLAAFSYQNQLTELSLSAHKTDLVYRKDNSLLLKATSRFDVTLKQQNTQLDLVVTADRLGLTQADFDALGGKPIEIRFSFSQMNAQIEFHSETRVVKKTRTVQEILQDLTEALTDIFSRRGDKSIAVLMDEEAFDVLTGDPKIAGLMDEIFALIEVINHLKLEEGQRDLYAILLSGKGKPYIDHQESTTANIESRTESVSLTILPPADPLPAGEAPLPEPQESKEESL